VGEDFIGDGTGAIKKGMPVNALAFMKNLDVGLSQQ
jgi:hypothetical protein